MPTSYSQVKEEELISYGFKAVIYANHLLRAAYPAMQNIANTITNKRALEAENKLMSIKILELIPGTDMVNNLLERFIKNNGFLEYQIAFFLIFLLN